MEGAFVGVGTRSLGSAVVEELRREEAESAVASHSY